MSGFKDQIGDNYYDQFHNRVPKPDPAEAQRRKREGMTKAEALDPEWYSLALPAIARIPAGTRVWAEYLKTHLAWCGVRPPASFQMWGPLMSKAVALGLLQKLEGERVECKTASSHGRGGGNQVYVRTRT